MEGTQILNVLGFTTKTFMRAADKGLINNEESIVEAAIALINKKAGK